MKLILRTLLPFTLLTAIFVSCNEPDAWDKVPSTVSAFIQKYWPGQDLNYVSNEKEKCTVIIKNGPTLEFNDGAWTSIKGSGTTLPTMLIYDQLPDALYRYLENQEAVSGVYGLQRTDTNYDVTLLNSKLSYNIATGEITAVVS